ncbi:hypothetical protein [Gordonia iterans]
MLIERSRDRAALWTVSALLSAAICAPLFGGYLLHRDAVATPRSPLTAAAFGIDGTPPRAVPQDALIALASQVLDGGLLLAAVTALALFFAGVGYGRLAGRLVPGCGTAGVVAAAIVAIWNPFVAERLLQGHWSLLTGYAALGWIVCAVLDLRVRPGWASWLVLAGLLAAAGFTPTGSVLGVIVAVVAALSPAGRFDSVSAGASPGSTSEAAHPDTTPRSTRERRDRGHDPHRSTRERRDRGHDPHRSTRERRDRGHDPHRSLSRAEALAEARVERPPSQARLLAGVIGLWVLTASPWLVATAFSDGGTSGVGGAREFAARAETGLGTFGSVLGLGGIWNADAVPASRTFWWAAVATACLLIVVTLGSFALWRRRTALLPAVRALAVLAGIVVLLTALAATGPGLAVVEFLLARVPGTGLLRDSQKYLALAIPFVALAAAAAAARLRAWVPTWFTIALVMLLVVAPLPDLAWGVGGKLRPIRYPSDYAAVTALVGHSTGAAAVVPSGAMRHYTWNNGPSLSPLPRMLDAPVILGSALLVDGEPVDAPPERSRRVIDEIARGGLPAALADLGVSWVVIEKTAHSGAVAAPRDLVVSALRGHHAERVFDGDDLTVYRVSGPGDFPAPTPLAWAAAAITHGGWLLLLIAGLSAQLRRVTSRRTAANSAAVPGQE